MNTITKWLMALALVVWSGCALAQTYTAIQLSSLSGNIPDPAAINASGQIVGSDYMSGGTEPVATLWNGATPSALSTPLGYSTVLSLATGINASGQIVGMSDSETYSVATIWNGAVATELTAPGWNNSAASGINDAGQVVGNVGNPGVAHAALWNGGVFTDLGGLPGLTDSVANGINNSGEIVGFSYNSAGAERPTAWIGSTVVQLSASGVAYAVNASGQIVGISSLGATLWNGTAAKSLGTLNGQIGTPVAINNLGEAVGTVDIVGDTNPHAVLWTRGGTAIDLNSVLSPALALYVTLTEATAINDNGWITAFGTDNATGQNDAYAFVLMPNPVPLPASAWPLLSGLVGIGAFARKCGMPK